MSRLQRSQVAVSKAHGLSGLRPSSSLRWFNFAINLWKRRGFFGMARHVDVLACKPEDLFLVVSQVERQLARKSLKVLDGRKKIPVQVFSIMSEHIIPATDSGCRFLGPSELGTTLLSCTKAHWESCGILPGYLPTSSRFSYTLPDDAEMFMNGVLMMYIFRNGKPTYRTYWPSHHH